MKLNLANPIVFFDLETTGINITTDRESNFAGSGNQGAYPTVKRFNLGVKFTL